MSDLVELAERCERATGPDRELDSAICRAIGPAAEQPDGTWMLYFEGGYRHSLHPPELTASIDAAMTLVPEGWTVANLCQSDRKGWWAELRHGYLTSYDKVAIGQQLENATPALALCAAALRARAAEPEGNHP